MGLRRYIGAALGAVACAPHAAGVPPGPPPEYEQPRLPAWDAGAKGKVPEAPKTPGDGGLPVAPSR